MVAARRRFFLWVHLYDPHQWKGGGGPAESTDYAAFRTGDEPDEAFYPTIERLHGLPRAEDGTFPVQSWGVTGLGKHGLKTHEVTSRRQIVEHVDDYDARIHFADRQLQRLHSGIERSSPGNTLRIVTADHGEGIGSHGFYGHGKNLYEEQLRDPLIVWGSLGPKQPVPAGRTPDPVALVDILPTLADLLEATPREPDRFLGSSLLGALRGAAPPGDRVI